MKWQDNCNNPWHGVDDAGNCAKGCFQMFLLIVAVPCVLATILWWWLV